ncbi:MAG: type I DNA topoisomerase [Burkholderiales bacterium]
MSSTLVIVESPSKAKTLKKYLGDGYRVLATYGHVRDLVPKQGAVDTEHGFAMNYALIERNAKHVDAIASAVKQADKVYLATDPDREGEAIAWHVAEILAAKKLLRGKPLGRVVFHEITQSAIDDAVAQPRKVSVDLVNAQQARRALDYLVGFNLSPLLWRKIRRGLSAGRVQSPALRLIVERELEIEAFKPREYWTVHLDSHKAEQKFRTLLIELGGQKISQFSITSEAQYQQALAVLQQDRPRSAIVTHLQKRAKQRHAFPPFTTSTLQQEAVRKLGFTTDRTMKVAQQLYEGIDVGEGAVGLITYMRTDSVSLANEAVQDIRRYIAENFDPAYLPKTPLRYRNQSKNAQEAHEAIRPTAIVRTPTSIKRHLTAEQAKLYEMIWKRALACQMAAARYDTVSADLGLSNKQGTFRASGQTLVFAGFLEVYREADEDQEEEADKRLPPLIEGESLPVDALLGEQHFTQPPPRFSEASLVKTLEEHGIGRPSTYASIISTLLARDYAVLDKKRFIPTDVGRVVTKFLTEHFTRYVDYDFTAKLEDQLDEISNGKRQWVPVLEEFWGEFHKQVQEKSSLARKDVVQEQMDEACPKCGKPLSSRLGKRGMFIGCSAYPQCDYTRAVDGSPAPPPPQVVEGRVCPNCEGVLHIRSGPYGKFIGCSAYPKCRFIESLEKPKDTGVVCPTCKQGSLIERRGRYGKVFYSCNTYPKCRYAVWNPPLNEACPNCGWPILTLKTTRRKGEEKLCPQKECGFSAAFSDAVEPTKRAALAKA